MKVKGEKFKFEDYLVDKIDPDIGCLDLFTKVSDPIDFRVTWMSQVVYEALAFVLEEV